MARGGLRQTAAGRAYGSGLGSVFVDAIPPGTGRGSFSMQLKTWRCIFESMLVVICGA